MERKIALLSGLHCSTVSLGSGVRNMLRVRSMVSVLSLWMLGWGNLAAQGILRDSIALDTLEIRDDRIPVPPVYQRTLLGETFLDQETGQNLSEVLSDHTPVHIKSYGPGQLSTPSFRGTGASHTQVFWNGIPLNSPTLGQSDLATFPVALIDQVELHHGASSMLEGSGGLGGSIRLTDKVHWKDPLRVGVDLLQGSFGTYQGSGSIEVGRQGWRSRTRVIARKARNDISFQNVAKPDEPLEHLTHANAERYGLIQEVFGKLNARNTVSAKVWLNRAEKEIPRTLLMEQSRQHQTNEALRTMAEWKRTGMRSRLLVRAAYFQERMEYTDPASNIASTTQTQTSRNRVRYFLRLTPQLKLRTGAFFDHEKAITDGYGQSHMRNRTGGFIGGQYKPFQRLMVDLTLREEWTGESFTPLMPAMGTDLLISKKLGLHWKLNTARNFRIPTFNDLYWSPGGNPDLAPEEGWTHETGLLLEQGTGSGNFRHSTEITGYYSHIRNWIQWLPTDKGYWSPVNAREVINQGVEFSGEYTYGKGDWSAGAMLNYAFTSSQDQSREEDGLQLIYVPFHQGDVSLKITWKERTWIRYGVSYTGMRYIDQENQTYLPAFWLNHVQAGQRLKLGNGHAVKLKVAVRNLFDIPYQSVAWRPMPGRHYNVSLAYDLKQ